MDERVRAVIAFMSTNLDRKLTTVEIAQTVRLSPAHLRELFKHETGTSLMKYRRDLQMDRAKHLLETTFLSVKEVAATVGITGLSHFGKNFEQRFGAKPSRYPARHHNNAA